MKKNFRVYAVVILASLLVLSTVAMRIWADCDEPPQCGKCQVEVNCECIYWATPCGDECCVDDPCKSCGCCSGQCCGDNCCTNPGPCCGDGCPCPPDQECCAGECGGSGCNPSKNGCFNDGCIRFDSEGSGIHSYRCRQQYFPGCDTDCCTPVAKQIICNVTSDVYSDTQCIVKVKEGECSSNSVRYSCEQ